MDGEYRQSSFDGSKKEEDSINPNEKLLNGDHEDQKGEVPVQIQLKEEVSHPASEYSSFGVDEGDVNVNTSIREQKKVKHRILVTVGLSAIVLIAVPTALGFVLFCPLLGKSENVTYNAYSTLNINGNLTLTTVVNSTTNMNITPTLNIEVNSTSNTNVTSVPELHELVHENRTATEEGITTAPFHHGIMYESGQGVNKSYEKTAEQGDANAQYHLGLMYQYGKGVPESDEEAVKWYIKAAEQGHANAQLKMGFMYEDGIVVPQSDEEAVKWYRKSADQRNALAQFNLGLMYLNERGVSQSDDEALQWFRKAAEQGNADAQYNIGMMYGEGKGVNKSDEEAAKWYKKAAEQDYPDAQSILGWMYQEAKEKPLKKAMQLRNFIWGGCMKMVEAGLDHLKKL
uniref:Uncharacterized protein n=1 Tax=Plectus sambesii TaxID=2011161 RepID=A0A914W2X8_9BILA